MAGVPLRGRFFTPRVARALVAPSGLLLGAVVAVVAAVAGLPLVAAIPLGVVVWAGKVALAVPRTRAERIDPFTLHEPWRRFVQDALQARNRFDEVVLRLDRGPLHERLSDIAQRMHTGVDETWRIAQRGEALVRARRGIDLAAVDRQREQLATGEPAEPADPAQELVARSLDQQKATAERLDRVIDQAHGQLRMLDARMGEAVARALELSTQSVTGAVTSSVGTLGTDVDNLVTEMEALRQALDETRGIASGDVPPDAPG